MDILLAVAVISVLEVFVLRFGFRSLERAEETRARAEMERATRAERARSRFFGENAGLSVADDAAFETLLARLERHVKLEQQAAQVFLDHPTPETLHSRSAVRLRVTH